ncbi:hypothetical protein D9613_004413 [Agrocybe pediades]|uniref:Uncharacterized protein n=1 Tax=Agrocybe pediades TaxID=84607 RepID=A0A8H4QKG6_9AGAR|nr:hypothetical protein D9613_004413 [Agrocybe pediades]
MVSTSAPHLTRDDFRESTPRPGTNDPPPHTPRRIGPPRQRQTTDNDFVTEKDDTSSKGLSVDIICTPTTESKKPTDVLLELLITFDFNIPRAGANIAKENTCSTKAHHKSGGIPLAELNVGHTNVDPQTTSTAQYLDDLSRWDMEYLSHNSKTLSNGFFSGDIDDESFYNDYIPFPLNRHSNVVLENMRVKKAKTLAKVRSGGGTPIRQVHFPRAEPTLFGTQDEYCGLPGLPHPLPLHTLYRYTNPIPSRHRSVTRRDSYDGITHLGSADCELSIIFPHSAHFEVWDMGDNAIMGCAVILSIAAKDPEEWAGVPIAVPEVSLVEVKCEDTPFPSCVSKYDPSQEFSVTYTGSKTGTSTDDGTSISQNPKPKSRSNSTGTDGISIEGHWTRVYAKTDGSDEEDHTPRWNLQIWIPIPTRLFEKRETRAFNVSARIWLMGDERRALSLDGNVDGEVIPLLADAEMTVSHLRREREMERFCF